MPAQLTVAVGARFMLRRNMSIRDRLVNGATGHITELKMKDEKVEYIFVQFGGTTVSVPIRIMAAPFLHRDTVMIREQFPLVIAYGATIHKSQGLTLRNVVVRSRNIFQAGMFYVAVSRVTSLKGLHLAGLHTNKIIFDEDASKEANRLRSTLNPPLSPLQCGVNPKKNMSDYYEAANDSKQAA
ncbi:Protein CBG03690 [Caenorhabditis briggsae]|uniref:Protein CBG03690 n=1 Tax=Caenorhabditis briggsae TaxID=6238 RepID=A8WVL6_CAEBR|nr:Protein CBG03690 [Caenorhabditis briggsae]CAP24527.2 Protein CBG03690 [Caenorhabditis briggsae]